jgi:hypothetical protein
MLWKEDLLKINMVFFFLQLIFNTSFAQDSIQNKTDLHDLIVDSTTQEQYDLWLQDSTQALTLYLHTDPFWLDLLHYKKKPFGKYSSKIDPYNFFLSTKGQENPALELFATIKAFRSLDNLDSNSHAQCRFPARLEWLKSKGLSFQNLPKTTCKSLNQWVSDSTLKSMSLVFASGYLKNPASYFGHIFLKFNKNHVTSSQNLLNPTVNFGADVPATDGEVIYAIKGLTGLYSSFYSQNDFYTQQFNYGANELRDLWEYELDIPPQDLKMIQLRVWELFAKKFKYYFLDENCALYIVDPIEKQLLLELIPHHLPYVLPKMAIEKLPKLKYNNSPIVKSIQYIPSKQAIFYNKYNQLSLSEKSIFRKIIANKKPDFEINEYISLPPKKKIKFIDVLLEYNSYIYAGTNKSLDEKKEHQRILNHRFDLPPFEDSDYQFKPISAISPDKAPPTTLLSLKHSFDLDKNQRLHLLYRPANHDLLSSNTGRSPNSAVSAFEMQFSTNAKNIEVDYFDFLKIISLNTSTTQLPGDGDMAWSAQIGYGPDQLGCLDCKVAKLRGSIGYTLGHQKSTILPYAMLGGQIQHQENNLGFINLHSYLGIIINQNPNFGLRSETGINYGYKNLKILYPFALLEGKLLISQNIDLRMNIEYEIHPQIKTSLYTYW